MFLYRVNLTKKESVYHSKQESTLSCRYPRDLFFCCAGSPHHLFFFVLVPTHVCVQTSVLVHKETTLQKEQKILLKIRNADRHASTHTKKPTNKVRVDYQSVGQIYWQFTNKLNKLCEPRQTDLANFDLATQQPMGTLSALPNRNWPNE